MDTPPVAMTKPSLSLDTIANLLGDVTRWRLLAELAKGQPLPVIELARRLRVPATNISKHITALRDCGVVQRSGFGRDYRIAEPYCVPGERAVDLGWALVRLEKVA